MEEFLGSGSEFEKFNSSNYFVLMWLLAINPWLEAFICRFVFFVLLSKISRQKKNSCWHRKNDVFNPIISDHCWWCGQEHLTVHAQNPKKNLPNFFLWIFFWTVLKMSILFVNKLGLGKPYSWIVCTFFCNLFRLLRVLCMKVQLKLLPAIFFLRLMAGGLRIFSHCERQIYRKICKIKL